LWEIGEKGKKVSIEIIMCAEKNILDVQDSLKI